MATTGVTSTAAMISCCAHYLVNLLPILGAVGVITVISQYQIQLFWIGLAFNFAGIAYMASRVYKFSPVIPRPVFIEINIQTVGSTEKTNLRWDI